MLRRYVLTGTPGSGKTCLLEELRRRGHAVLEEVATDVIVRQQARGVDEPWLRKEFIDVIANLQHERVSGTTTDSGQVQFRDRSPLCTLALARHLRVPVSPLLAAEVTRSV